MEGEKICGVISACIPFGCSTETTVCAHLASLKKRQIAATKKGYVGRVSRFSFSCPDMQRIGVEKS
jgi:hypothetical protein